MTEYIVKFTDKNKTPITVYENSIDYSSTDIALPGRKKLEYGKDLNANFLHILENFACPEMPNNTTGSILPDFNKVSDNGNKKLLTTPIQGQFWYNTTQETLFVFNGAEWMALGMRGDIAANWGVIRHGQQIPKPVNSFGYVFDYEECSWIVSPFRIEGAFRYMQCTTDEQALVTMTYTPDIPEADPIEDCATYMIVGIKGNKNLGELLPIPDPTPIPSPTPTPTPSVTNSMRPSPTASVTPTPGVSATRTPLPTPTKTPAASLTPTPSPVVYSANITANPSGLVSPGQNICYTITLNYPAPAGGQPVRFVRSGGSSKVCASTAGETQGPIIEDTTIVVPANQLSTQVCRTAPAAPPPPPTPTAAPRYACRTTAAPDANGINTTFMLGFMCATTNGGPKVYFTNASSNYNQCTQWSACNTATSFQSTQTIADNPTRNNRVYYNATPCANLRFLIRIPGVGEVQYANFIYGTNSIVDTQQVSIGNRVFTVTVNLNPVLISSSGGNKTWTINADYSVLDNETNSLVTTMC